MREIENGVSGVLSFGAEDGWRELFLGSRSETKLRNGAEFRHPGARPLRSLGSAQDALSEVF